MAFKKRPGSSWKWHERYDPDLGVWFPVPNYNPRAPAPDDWKNARWRDPRYQDAGSYVPLLLSHPSEAGYGGYEWPFSAAVYLESSGYARGVQRALESAAFSPRWKAAASRLIAKIDATFFYPGDLDLDE